ncbi:MAG: ACP S-malonyltransferase [Methylococcaceae bacterium]
MKSYLFPGQGTQIKGMGENLFDLFPELAAKADEVLGYSIKALCLEDVNRQLNLTQYTQPAIYVVNALTYLHRINHTINTPDFVAGHSLGEYNALHAAKALSFEDGLRLVKKRGELMGEAAKGAMAAVLKINEDKIKQCLKDNDLNTIDIANYNAPTQIVLSGLQEDINRAQTCFEHAGADYIPLNTSGAFHSRYMAPAQTEFEKYLETFTFTDLQIPVIANSNAEPYQQHQIKQNLVNQITQSVRWQQSMQYLLLQGVFDFEEIGIGDVLTKLMTWIKTDFITAGQKNNQTDNLPQKIDDWNKTYPIGTKVKVVNFKEELATRTKAKLSLGHREAIYLQGYKGYFELNNVTPVVD